MKALATTIIATAALFITTSCNTQDKTTSTEVIDGTKITVTENTITIDGKELPRPLQADKLITALGEPDKTLHLANTVRTWDKLGLCAYSRPDSTTVHEINLDFTPSNYKFSPASQYQGTITVAANTFTHKSTVKDLKKLSFKQDQYLRHIYTNETPKLTTLAITNKDRIDSIALSLKD